MKKFYSFFLFTLAASWNLIQQCDALLLNIEACDYKNSKKAFTIETQPHETVESLKNKILSLAKEQKLSSENCYLFAQKLSEKNTLADCQLTDASTIYFFAGKPSKKNSSSALATSAEHFANNVKSIAHKASEEAHHLAHQAEQKIEMAAHTLAEKSENLVAATVKATTSVVKKIKTATQKAADNARSTLRENAEKLSTSAQDFKEKAKRAFAKGAKKVSTFALKMAQDIESPASDLKPHKEEKAQGQEPLLDKEKVEHTSSILYPRE